mmetsp:Transcript_29157/g.93995  ORF Transcript_29157/g.93995 Transcript_29157/m.93995 type:complete len:246 (+) Transcript_29157:761-1498(+)|eukprot:scaffold21359_cov112-Isochrysis_galbana.AAC.3
MSDARSGSERCRLHLLLTRLRLTSDRRAPGCSRANPSAARPSPPILFPDRSKTLSPRMVPALNAEAKACTPESEIVFWVSARYLTCSRCPARASEANVAASSSLRRRCAHNRFLASRTAAVVVPAFAQRLRARRFSCRRFVSFGLSRCSSAREHDASRPAVQGSSGCMMMEESASNVSSSRLSRKEMRGSLSRGFVDDDEAPGEKLGLAVGLRPAAEPEERGLAVGLRLPAEPKVPDACLDVPAA